MIISGFGKPVVGKFKLYNQKAQVIAEFELTTQKQYDDWIDGKDNLLCQKNKTDLLVFIPNG